VVKAKKIEKIIWTIDPLKIALKTWFKVMFLIVPYARRRVCGARHRDQIGWLVVAAGCARRNTLGTRCELDCMYYWERKRQIIKLLWPPNSSALLSQTFTTTICTTSQHYSKFQKITFTTSKWWTIILLCTFFNDKALIIMMTNFSSLMIIV
jgi:hypothetical protein